MKTAILELPPQFSFKATVYSHGWCELEPFGLDTETWTLKYVFRGSSGAVSTGSMSESHGRLAIGMEDGSVPEMEAVEAAKHLLRLDDDLGEFYELLGSEETLPWVEDRLAGRLLRSANVFEDLVKTICTTNCSWSLTKSMVTNLVRKLGEPTAGGGFAFPTPEQMSGVDADFYKTEIRAGYRGPYLLELAERVASSDLDPEEWLHSELPANELKKEMKKVKGVGDYAADNLLKLVGRYDGLALDSWLRSQFYKKHNAGKVCPDTTIETFYERFGKWRGLAIWCDMTEKWIA